MGIVCYCMFVSFSKLSSFKADLSLELSSKLSNEFLEKMEVSYF